MGSQNLTDAAPSLRRVQHGVIERHPTLALSRSFLDPRRSRCRGRRGTQSANTCARTPLNRSSRSLTADKLDPYADKLSQMLREESGKSRKQKRTTKQLHADLAALGDDGPRIGWSAFARDWKTARQQEQPGVGSLALNSLASAVDEGMLSRLPHACGHVAPSARRGDRAHQSPHARGRPRWPPDPAHARRWRQVEIVCLPAVARRTTRRTRLLDAA